MQVDIKHFRKPTMLLEWMGMNALIVYALAACDLFPAAVKGFYLHSLENNLVILFLCTRVLIVSHYASLLQ